MTVARFALASDRVITPEGERAAAVIIAGERIEAVVERAAVPADVPCEELGELALLPGLVDCHVHVNQPGRTHWEGFDTATRAAAAGGVTTLVDMPLNCLPVTTNVAALEAKLAELSADGDTSLWIDVGFWGGVVPGNAGELAALAARGVLGCKAFLCDSGIPEFPASDAATLRAAMIELAKAGIPLLAHAELELPAPEGHPTDPHDYGCWLHSRPAAWEEAAIALLIDLCRETGCRVHIVHLSAASAIPLLRAARAEGLPITVETCPHYLCLSAEEVPAGATHFKCAPPVREASNREGLWAGLREGVIDLVVTNHSPCTPELKGDDGDFMAAWGGIASLSLGLASVWTQARERGCSLAQVVEWMAAAPARMSGLAHKGALRPGCDADLVVFDPELERVVTAESLHFRHKLSPWIGRSLTGKVARTWLRGRAIYDASRTPMFVGPCGTPLLRRA